MRDRNRLAELLAGMAQVRLAVVGDFCLDGYWTADMTRSELSRETPHFPLPVVAERYAPGGAGNVAMNAAALGVAQVSALTVLGRDWRGGLLKDSLAAGGINVSGVVKAKGWATPAYIKPILRGHDSAQEGARLDFANHGPLPEAAERELIAALEAVGPQCQAILVGDQLAWGVISPRLRQRLSDLVARQPALVAVADSRSRISAFTGLSLKPNELELARACNQAAPAEGDLAGLAQLGLGLAGRARRPVYVTVGSGGALVCTEGGWTLVPAVRVEPPLDIVGAGDTFLAALGATLAAGGSPTEAALLGNLAAAVTIKKLNQTGTATATEIRESYERWLAQNP